MELPFWYRLVELWCQNRTGLTVPLIVGADARYRGASPAVEDVSRLLKEMRQHRVPGGCIRVMQCPDLRAPVVNVSRYGKVPFVIDESVTKEKSQEEALRLLVEDAEYRVGRGEFSRVGDWPAYRWAVLQPEDLEFIDRVIEQSRRSPGC